MNAVPPKSTTAFIPPPVPTQPPFVQTQVQPQQPTFTPKKSWLDKLVEPLKNRNLIPKKMKPQYVIGAVVLFLLVTGVAAASLLSTFNQDVRQQASTALYDNVICSTNADCGPAELGYICTTTPYGRYCKQDSAVSDEFEGGGCGDGICSQAESYASCPADCEKPTTAVAERSVDIGYSCTQSIECKEGLTCSAGFCKEIINFDDPNNRYSACQELFEKDGRGTQYRNRKDSCLSGHVWSDALCKCIASDNPEAINPNNFSDNELVGCLTPNGGSCLVETKAKNQCTGKLIPSSFIEENNATYQNLLIDCNITGQENFQVLCYQGNGCSVYITQADNCPNGALSLYTPIYGQTEQEVIEEKTAICESEQKYCAVYNYSSRSCTVNTIRGNQSCPEIFADSNYRTDGRSHESQTIAQTVCDSNTIQALRVTCRLYNSENQCYSDTMTETACLNAGGTAFRQNSENVCSDSNENNFCAFYDSELNSCPTTSGYTQIDCIAQGGYFSNDSSETAEVNCESLERTGVYGACSYPTEYNTCQTGSPVHEDDCQFPGFFGIDSASSHNRCEASIGAGTYEPRIGIEDENEATVVTTQQPTATIVVSTTGPGYSSGTSNDTGTSLPSDFSAGGVSSEIAAADLNGAGLAREERNTETEMIRAARNNDEEDTLNFAQDSNTNGRELDFAKDTRNSKAEDSEPPKQSAESAPASSPGYCSVPVLGGAINFFTSACGTNQSTTVTTTVTTTTDQASQSEPQSNFFTNVYQGTVEFFTNVGEALGF